MGSYGLLWAPMALPPMALPPVALPPMALPAMALPAMAPPPVAILEMTVALLRHCRRNVGGSDSGEDSFCLGTAL